MCRHVTTKWAKPVPPAALAPLPRTTSRGLPSLHLWCQRWRRRARIHGNGHGATSFCDNPPPKARDKRMKVLLHRLRDHGPGLSSDSLWVSSTWAPLLRISVRTARLLLLSISIPRTGTERPHLRLSALMWATEEPHGGNLQNLEIMSWSHPELGTRAPRRRPAPFAAVARVRAADMPSVRLFLFRSASGAVRMRDWPCVLPDLNLPVRSPVSGGCSRNHCNRSVAARSSSLSQCRGLLTAPAAGSANDRHAIHLPWSYTVCLQMLQCQP